MTSAELSTTLRALADPSRRAQLQRLSPAAPSARYADKQRHAVRTGTPALRAATANVTCHGYPQERQPLAKFRQTGPTPPSTQTALDSNIPIQLTSRRQHAIGCVCK